jgi:small subunit ribosomal protein S6
MYKYELMIIFDADDKTFEENKTSALGILTSNDSKIIEEKNIGVKNLAFPVKEKPKGHYYLVVTEIEPTSFKEIEKAFKLNKGILRHLFIRI